MKDIKHMRIAVAFTSLLLAGCNIFNPIKKLECEITLANGTSTYEKGRNEKYILNTKTGEIYEKDELSGKLELINGRTSDMKYHYDTRTLIANNEWKMELIISEISPSIYEFKPSKGLYTLNLKNMEITKTSHSFSNGVWEKTGSSAGKCKWTTPDTTEILKKSKN